MQVKVSVDARQVNASLKRLSALTSKSIPEICNDAAYFFSQSAEKYTLPRDGGRSIPRKKRLRTIYRLHNEKGRVTAEKVPFRTYKKSGRKYFHNDSKGAKEFAKIKFRGLSCAAWAATRSKIPGAKNATVSGAAGYAPDAIAAGRRFAEVNRTLSQRAMDYFITVGNTTAHIVRFGTPAVRTALTMTDKRLKILVAKLESNMVRAWR